MRIYIFVSFSEKPRIKVYLQISLIAAERERGSTLFLTLHEVTKSPAELYIVKISIFAVKMSKKPGEN